MNSDNPRSKRQKSNSKDNHKQTQPIQNPGLDFPHLSFLQKSKVPEFLRPSSLMEVLLGTLSSSDPSFHNLSSLCQFLQVLFSSGLPFYLFPLQRSSICPSGFKRCSWLSLHNITPPARVLLHLSLGKDQILECPAKKQIGATCGALSGLPFFL